VASVVNSDSSSFVDGAGTGGIGVFGSGTIAGLRWLRPLNGGNPQPERGDTLILGVDHKDFQQNVTLASEVGFATPIHYLPWTVGYSGFRADPAGTTEFGLSYLFALRGLGSSSPQVFEDKRAQANPNFSLLRFNLGRTWLLAAGTQLVARVDGQWTDAPLVSNEQFVAGGAGSVRGYLESTAAADRGLRGSIEWRSANLLGPAASAGVAAADGASGAALQWRVFSDAARLRVLSPLPDSTASYSLLSIGTGLGYQPMAGFDLNADLGWPLRASTFQKARQPRLQASASYSF
jgi:hemolysin activation/secretion protein